MRPQGRFDVGGALLASLALAGVTWALTDPGSRWMPWAAGVGVAAVVAFVARSKPGGRAQRRMETSRFVREAGRWYYVDGDIG